MYKLLYIKLLLLVFTLPNLVKGEIPVDSVLTSIHFQVRDITMSHENYDKAYELVDSALIIGYANGKYQKLSTIVGNYSVILERDGRLTEAKSALNKIMKYHDQMDSLFFGILLSKRGIIYLRENNTDSAKLDLQYSIEVLQTSKVKVLLADSYYNLAEINHNENDLYEATVNLFKASKIFYDINLNNAGNECLNHISIIYRDIELYEESLKILYELKARIKGKEILGVLTSILDTYDNIEDEKNELLILREFEGAYIQYYDSLSSVSQFVVDNRILTYYLSKDKISEAKVYNEKILQNNYFQTRETKTCNNIAQLFYYYVKTGDKNMVNQLLDKYIILNSENCKRKNLHQYYLYAKLLEDQNMVNELLLESVKYNNDENRKINSNKMAYMYAKFESEKKEQEIKLQEAEIEILKEKDTNKTRLIWFSIIGGLGLGIFLFLRVRMYRLQKNALQNKNKLVESEKKFLNVQLQTKEKALTDFAHHLSQKNEALEELREKVQIGLDKELHKEEILSLFSQDRIQEENWNDLQSRFSKVHASFFEKLKQKYPQLSVADEKLCVLIKLGMSSKEIANILLISPKSIDQKKYRLKKKIDGDSVLSITELLMNL